jgi:tetratricopeptide (TPR) repeat protein
MAGKITKKELKEPDFLQVELAKLVQFFMKHQAKVYILLLFFLLGAVVEAGWYLYKLNYERSAQKVYSQVETLSLKSNAAQRESAKLVDGFRNVVSKYPRSKAALHSYYQLGNLYLNANQPDLAIRAYDEFIKRASDKNYLKVFAYTGKGYCHEMKKDFKEALLSLESALKMPDGDILQGQIYRDMALVYEEMNDQKKSLEYYRKALEKTSDPTMGSIIKRKIAAIS